MKYAILGPRNGVLRVTDEEPKVTPPNGKVVQVTQDQADTIKAGFEASPKIIYFLEDNRLVSQEEKREAFKQQNKPKVSAEKWIESQGYTALRLVALKDIEDKLASFGLSSEKVSPVRAWLNIILAEYAANPEPRNDWSPAPYTFEEAIQDGAASLPLA